MIISNLTSRLLRPFANAGAKATIPLSQTDATRASYEQGFPALNMTPIAAGGTPPHGHDINGILHDLSNAALWQQATGILPWDAGFAQSPVSGGYPKNALVIHNAMLYQSSVDNNTSTPGSDTNWQGIGVASATQPQHAVTQRQMQDGLAQHTHPDATPSATGFMSAADKRVLDWLAGVIAPEAAPAGQVAFFARQNVYKGWLVANGAAVSRTAYANLFAAIGTFYGPGDGSTTFNLPDLRGEFVRGWDAGRGVDSGRTFGSYQGDAIRNITGYISGSGQFNFFDVAHGAFGMQSAHAQWFAQGGTLAGYNDFDFDVSRVVPTAAENRPRNVALLPCIKY